MSSSECLSEWDSNQADHDECESSDDYALSSHHDSLDSCHPQLKIHCDSETSEDEHQLTDDYDLQTAQQHVVRLTKHIVLPSLCLIFIVSIAQIMLINFNFTTKIHQNEVVLLYIWNNSTTFTLAFSVTVTLSMIGSVLSCYADHKWQSILSHLAWSTQREHRSKEQILRSIAEKKRTINTYKQQIKRSMHDLHKVCFDNNKLELMANRLLAYKQEAIATQNKYRRRTKRTIFRQYLKDIEKQYQDLQGAINENQLALLSIILSQVRISKNKYLRLHEYKQYESMLNANTRKELNLRGGFHALHAKQQRSDRVDLSEFVHLIETVIDVIEENQCTFVNY